MARKKQRSTSKNSPLPYRDGVPPSYLILPCDEEHPEGRWPDLLSFLQHRFPHIEPETLRHRSRPPSPSLAHLGHLHGEMWGEGGG